MGERKWQPQYNPHDPVWAEIGELISHLPDSYLEPTWGVLTLRVERKLFAGAYGGIDYEPHSIIFKPNPDELPYLQKDPRFSQAPHFTKWLALELLPDWNRQEVKELLTDSYLLVAPKRLSRLITQP